MYSPTYRFLMVRGMLDGMLPPIWLWLRSLLHKTPKSGIRLYRILYTYNIYMWSLEGIQFKPYERLVDCSRSTKLKTAWINHSWKCIRDIVNNANNMETIHLRKKKSYIINIDSKPPMPSSKMPPRFKPLSRLNKHH